MYEGHVYKRPKRGDAVLYVTNTRINKTRTFTGLDYEVGLMGIYSRSDLRASIFRENDTHANQFLFFAKEKITKLRERVFEMEYSFEIAGMY